MVDIQLNEQRSKVLLQSHINNVKKMIEDAISKRVVSGSTTNKYGIEFANGQKAKESLIRSQKLIYELHEFTKNEFLAYGIDMKEIFPPINSGSPEVKLHGYFKPKTQDVCIVPNSLDNVSELVNWGAVIGTGSTSIYGKYKEERILSTNIRSQLSSVNKNIDTLFERMIAEALNLHLQYPSLVLGELYMIPVHEYDDSAMTNNTVAFKQAQTDIAKFINFFSFLNRYDGKKENAYKYNRAALVVVDFKQSIPKIYYSTDELKNDGLVPSDYHKELNELSPATYVYDLIRMYQEVIGPL